MLQGGAAMTIVTGIAIAGLLIALSNIMAAYIIVKCSSKKEEESK